MSAPSQKRESGTGNVELIAVRVEGVPRPVYCRTDGLELEVGDPCIVETPHGQELGEIVSSIRIAKERFLKGTGGKVVRKATTEDYAYIQRKREREIQAKELCSRLIREKGLSMKLVSASIAVDGSKATFTFTAEERVDFRELVRLLSQELKCRVEMRQVGVRDEARMLGGFGGCGRPLCCATFLKEFRPVSIRMAKAQGLSLIPSKISGICGRLMCCLTYEFEAYRDLQKRLPRVGKKILTPEGLGRLRQLNIDTESVQVELEDGQVVEMPIPAEGADSRTPEELKAEAVRIQAERAAAREQREEEQRVEAARLQARRDARRRAEKARAAAREDRTGSNSSTRSIPRENRGKQAGVGEGSRRSERGRQRRGSRRRLDRAGSHARKTSGDQAVRPGNGPAPPPSSRPPGSGPSKPTATGSTEASGPDRKKSRKRRRRRRRRHPDQRRQDR